MEYPVLVGINCDHCQACKTLIQNTRIVLYPLTALQGRRPPPSTEALLPEHPRHLLVMEEGWNYHPSTGVQLYPPPSVLQLSCQTCLWSSLEIPRQRSLVGSACTKIIYAPAASQEYSGHWTHCSCAVASLDSCCCHSHQECWQVGILLHTVATLAMRN